MQITPESLVDTSSTGTTPHTTVQISSTLGQVDYAPDVPLQVPEGIYLIRSARNGWVIETEDVKKEGNGVHVHTRPSLNGKAQTQLWAIQKVARQGFAYTIRSVATGLVLDVFLATDRQGSNVVAHGFNGGGNQSWSFWGAGQTSSGNTICTIRSVGLFTTLDSLCPAYDGDCDNLHATHLDEEGVSASQEWSLVNISSPQLAPSPSTPSFSTSRRPFLLQNVLTGSFATRIETINGSNVSLSEYDSARNLWTLNYVTIKEPLQMDCFAFVSTSTNPCTLDHYAGSFINVSKYEPENPHHQWIPSGRGDGTFIFRNVGSDQLLAASWPDPVNVHVMPFKSRDDAACRWRVVDAATKEPVRILHDSSLTLLPPNLVPGGRNPSVSPSQDILSSAVPSSLVLRSESAPREVRQATFDAFEEEHAEIRSMLNEGYEALVIAPRSISGWKGGRVKRVGIWNEGQVCEGRPRDFHPCD